MQNDAIIQEVEQWLWKNGYRRTSIYAYIKRFDFGNTQIVESSVLDYEIVKDHLNVIKTVESWHQFHRLPYTAWQNPGDTIPNWNFIDEPRKDMTKEEQIKLTQSLCHHLWLTYTGLNEKFDYCKKCDKKREINDKKF